MADCRSAREILTRWVFGERPMDEEAVRAAHEHVRGCRACATRLLMLKRAIESGDPVQIPCAEARSLLGGYRAGLASELDAARVRTHLARCKSCAMEANAWERIMALNARQALVEPPLYPTFDLSFLPQPAPLVDIWKQARAGVRRLAYEIPAALLVAGGNLLAPPPGLALSFAAVQPARRGPRQKSSERLVSLTVEDQPQDIGITLDVTGAEQAMWLAVRLRLLSTGKTLDGVRVALCNEHGKAQEIKTVRAGEADVRFPDLAHGHYVVRVERAGKSWELPLAL